MAGGCPSRDEITINVNNTPAAEAGPPIVICAGESGQLNASGGVAYQWTPDYWFKQSKYCQSNGNCIRSYNLYGDGHRCEWLFGNR